MTNIPDFSDLASAQAWLATQPPETITAIAVRSALRAAPGLSDWADAEVADAEALKVNLAIFRAVETSAVAVTAEVGGEEIRNAARSAFSAAVNTYGPSSAAGAPSSGAFSAYAAATSAVSSVFSAFSSNAASVADPAADAARTAPSAAFTAGSAFSATASDARQLQSSGNKATVFATPLWHDNEPPEPLSGLWRRLRETLRASDQNWEFWIDWYERHRDGRPQNWPLLGRIALIPNEDWEKGPAHVNAIIAEMAIGAGVAATPYGEDLKVDPATGLVYAVPIPISDEPTYERALQRVEDVLEDDFAGNFLGRGSYESRTLRRAITDYRDDPQRVHDDLVECRSLLEQQIESGHLPREGIGTAIVSRLDLAAVDIRRIHPQISDAARARAAQRIRDARVEERDALRARLGLPLEVVEPELARQMEEDSDRLLADVENAQEEGGPISPSGYRWGARTLRIADLAARGAVRFSEGVTAITELGMQIRSLFGV